MAHAVSMTDINSALAIVVGDPELVAVDARVMRLLLGDLAPLVFLGSCTSVDPRFGHGPVGGFRSALDLDDGPYIWDRDSPCD